MGKSLFDIKKALETKAGAKKVIGGTPAEEGRFDYATALLLDGDQFCGGSIIAPRVVLTASHCLDGITPTSIRTRCVDISNAANCEEIAVVQAILHPDYDPSTLSNDVGILILAEDSTAPPLRIAAQDFVLPNETPVTTIGWGVTDASGLSGTSEILLEADLEVVDRDFCEAQYDRVISVQIGDDYSFEQVAAGVNTIDDTMFCTLADEKDACQGDSGGSMLLRCDETKEDVVVGTVSFGIGCAYEGVPGVLGKTFTPQAFQFISSTVFEETGATVTTVDSLENFCLVGGTKAPTVAEDAPTPFPTFFEGNNALWTCDPGFYATNDGCDCECGIPDPDCASELAFVYGCGGGACNADGTCNFGEETDSPTVEGFTGGVEIGVNVEALVFVLVGVLASIGVIACVCIFICCCLCNQGNKSSTAAYLLEQQQPKQQVYATAVVGNQQTKF